MHVANYNYLYVHVCMGGFFLRITNFTNFAEYGLIRENYFLELFFFHAHSNFQVRMHVHEKCTCAHLHTDTLEIKVLVLKDGVVKVLSNKKYFAKP